jgi:hypothetical protein
MPVWLHNQGPSPPLQPFLFISHIQHQRLQVPTTSVADKADCLLNIHSYFFNLPTKSLFFSRWQQNQLKVTFWQHGLLL